MESDPNSTVDFGYMRRALELAREGTALASPNPRVGAVVVRDGAVVGTGSYDYGSRTHAEVKAIQQAGDAARGATLYLNLEPCSHTGRTPPCVDTILATGVKRVVAAMADPNPKVNGSGFRKLRDAGVEVSVGCLEREATRLNETFAKWIRTGVPFALLKAAMSLDGKIARVARRAGAPDWISGEAARANVQALRHEYDAVVAGIGTILADDPLLTDRTNLPRRRPLLRVLLDSHLRLPLGSKIVASADDDLVVFCAEEAMATRRAALESAGVRVCTVARRAHGLDLARVLEYLGDAEISSVMVEGGGHVFSSFVGQRLADKITLYVAPVVLGACGGVPLLAGELPPELRLRDLSIRQFGHDAVIEAYFDYLSGEQIQPLETR